MILNVSKMIEKDTEVDKNSTSYYKQEDRSGLTYSVPFLYTNLEVVDE